MKALVIILVIAAGLAVAVAWGLWTTQGASPGGAFLNAFYVALIGAAVAGMGMRRDMTTTDLGRKALYVLIWLGLIGAVMLILPAIM